MKKDLIILGSTGSIGSAALDVVRFDPGSFKVRALVCNSNEDLLNKQAKEFSPDSTVTLKNQNVNILNELISSFPGALVINGIVGIAGLAPTYYAINHSNPIAIANKETLIAGGNWLMDLAKVKGADILPVDSEHNALFQIKEHTRKKEIKKLYLTSSGGPFRGKTREQMKDISVAQALNHPTWKMGPKITIDSATLMNKALELLEAITLFEIPESMIEIIIHPESIVHGMIELTDGTLLALMGAPDMRGPISHAMYYPARKPSKFSCINLVEIGRLSFQAPDYETFRSLSIARKIARNHQSKRIAFSAANEVLVNAFLNQKISFLQISDILEKFIENFDDIDINSFEMILDIDKKARQTISNYI